MQLSPLRRLGGRALVAGMRASSASDTQCEMLALCCIRDPDGYLIEVGQSNPGVAYG